MPVKPVPGVEEFGGAYHHIVLMAEQLIATVFGGSGVLMWLKWRSELGESRKRTASSDVKAVVDQQIAFQAQWNEETRNIRTELRAEITLLTARVAMLETQKQSLEEKNGELENRLMDAEKRAAAAEAKQMAAEKQAITLGLEKLATDAEIKNLHLRITNLETEVTTFAHADMQKTTAAKYVTGNEDLCRYEAPAKDSDSTEAEKKR